MAHYVEGMMAAVTLVCEWLAHYTDNDMTKRDALDELNRALGTKYGHSNLSRWERGERDPGRDARIEMMRKALPRILKDHGKATPKDIEAALEKLR
jgi:hypothetical protein